MKSLYFSRIYKDICLAPTAVIDVGTNTIRLLVGCAREGKIVRIAQNRFITRLGKDLQKTGRLSQDSIEKSIISIIKLKEICKQLGVKKIIALGTSALREAENSKEFLADIKKSAGIDIEVISGEREAELTLKGILPSLSFPNFLLIDIGGGSTEWILYKKANAQNSNLKMGSIPIGAVMLSEKFIKNDPPLTDELKKIKEYILKEFSDSFNYQLKQTAAMTTLIAGLGSSLIACSSSSSLIATGGTATTLALIDLEMGSYNGDKIHLHTISIHTLKKIYNRLITLSFNDRSKIKGLEAERADIIISGTLILLTIIEALGISEVIISDYGLLEGALISYNYNHEKDI